jgi:hypothetical protein
MSLIMMHRCMNKLHPFRIDRISKSVNTFMRKVGGDRKIMVLRKMPAKIDKSRIYLRLASRNVDKPGFSGGIESFQPLDACSVNMYSGIHHSGRIEAVTAPKITRS